MLRDLPEAIAHSADAKRNSKDESIAEAPQKAQFAIAHGCSINGEISQIIIMAENNSGRVDYERARQEYNRVLQCEPSNRVARAGLEKINSAVRLNRREGR